MNTWATPSDPLTIKACWRLRPFTRSRHRHRPSAMPIACCQPHRYAGAACVRLQPVELGCLVFLKHVPVPGLRTVGIGPVVPAIATPLQVILGAVRASKGPDSQARLA